MASQPDSVTRPEHFVPLTDAECRSLLANNTLGRVGVTSGGLPVILPVLYRYDDGAITFRTGAGTKLRSAESGDVLAFEIDGYDADALSGWSVLVQGRASVSPGDELLPFEARLDCQLVSGRRVSGTTER